MRACGCYCTTLPEQVELVKKEEEPEEAPTPADQSRIITAFLARLERQADRLTLLVDHLCIRARLFCRQSAVFRCPTTSVAIITPMEGEKQCLKGKPFFASLASNKQLMKWWRITKHLEILC